MKHKFAVALAGALSVAAYAPLEYWWLMPFCLAVLYAYCLHSSPKQAAIYGFVFALAQFGVGASWVFVSLQTYGNMPVLMAGAAVMLFVAALASFTGIVAGLFSYIMRHLSRRCLALSLQHGALAAWVFASLFIIAEWLRSIVLTGFPWLDVGYSQTTYWLSGYAPLGSVYLVSFVLLLVSALLARIAMQCYSSWQDPQLSKLLSKPLLVSVAAVGALYFGGLQLKSVQWTQAKPEKITVAAVQANVPILEKWLTSYRPELFDKYSRLMPTEPVDLVVWPETALPIYLHQTSSSFWQKIGPKQGSLLTGITELKMGDDPASDRDDRAYNSAVLTCGDSQRLYRKRHLVPFGEYLPLRSMLSWVLDYLQLPMSDFSAWSAPQTLECNNLRLALSICYEDAFSAEVRNNLGSAEVLVNISEDAWFGDSLAPHQRVQMAQMRAQELARPMVRSANTGPSSIIEYDGSIIAATEQFVEARVVEQIYPRTGKTPFIRWGMWIIYLAFLTVAVSVIRTAMLRRGLSISQ